MNVGLGIVLLVVGAVLAFATTLTVHGFDLRIVGWILMAGGLLAIILGLAMSRRRGLRSHDVTQRDPVTGTEIHDARIEP